MNTLSGKILHAEQQTGLQDLTVLLYDIDFVLSGGPDFSHGNDGNTYIPPGLENLLPLSSNHPMMQQAAQVIFQLYTSTDDGEDPIWSFSAPAGGRLGSTLTGRDGGFVIQYEDAAFQNGDQEMRPEALLLILAPDQSLDTTLNDQYEQATFIGTPEYQRILHMSFFPLRNVARKEALVVKIAQEQLDRFNLSAGGQTGQSPEQINAQFIQAEAFNNGLVSVLRDRARANVSIGEERRVSANQFTRHLSALPKGVRETPYFLRRDELGTNRQNSVQARVSRDGIDRITDAPTGAPGRMPQAYLSIDSDWMADLLPNGGLDEVWDQLNAGEAVEVEVNYSTFCAMLYNKMGGTELVRRMDSLTQRATRDQVLARLEAIRNPPEDPTDNPDEEEPVDSPPPSGLSPEEQVKRIVLERVSALTAEPLPMNSADDSEEDQRRRISISLQELTPPVSPADATAFHDYTTLQIAFENIWTEAFDGNVEALVQQLQISYGEAYEAFREGEGDVLDRLSEFDEEELYDLKEYTELLGQLTGDIASLERRPMPPTVQRMLQGIEANSGPRRRSEEAQAGVLITEADQSQQEEQWSQLSIEQQAELVELAAEYVSFPRIIISTSDRDSVQQQAVNFLMRQYGKDDLDAAKIEQNTKLMKEVSDMSASESRMSDIIARKEEIKARVLAIMDQPAGRNTRAQRMMAELAERLKAPHSFRIFAENSYNFGILTTHRQKWVPGDYQTGSLVSTITLAPGEKRQYAKKEVLKKSRNRKEEEKNASTLNDERAFTSKATSDITSKVSTNTNFAQSVSGSVSGNLGVFSMQGQSSTQFSRDQATESNRQKEAIREATRKASQEYKNERTLAISTESSSEFESSFTSEISNPNNEITVTYLFYELERQYKVTEHLHKVTPVIMVAQYVPAPHQIDEDWLMANEWILRRVLLDRSFHDALDFVAQGLVSDEVALQVIRENYETQKALVDEASATVGSLSQLQETLRNSLIQTSSQEKMAETYAKRAKKKRRRRIVRRLFDPANVSGRIAGGNSSLTFGEYEDPALLEARREALETRLEYLDGNLEEAQSSLNTANSAFNQAAEELTAALKESFTRRNLVSQLKLHVKENILYYMQAIWTHEYSQQRYMRLFNLPIDLPMPGRRPTGGNPMTGPATLQPIPEHIREGLYGSTLSLADLPSLLGVSIQWPRNTSNNAAFHTVPRRLHQIADVDNMLGFKGNYMIFPLKTCTFITDYMMQDYVDEYLGIRSPDPVADLSTDELLKYAEQIWHHEDTTDAQRDALEQLIVERLQSPRTDDETIIVPTGQLFIEALKGNHALLEHYKLKHREMDVQKVQEEVRAAQLENLRKALRLLREEGELLDDPDVDKHIRIEGDSDDLIISPEG